MMLTAVRRAGIAGSMLFAAGAPPSIIALAVVAMVAFAAGRRSEVETIARRGRQFYGHGFATVDLIPMPEDRGCIMKIAGQTPIGLPIEARAYVEPDEARRMGTYLSFLYPAEAPREPVRDAALHRKHH